MESFVETQDLICNVQTRIPLQDWTETHSGTFSITDGWIPCPEQENSPDSDPMQSRMMDWFATIIITQNQEITMKRILFLLTVIILSSCTTVEKTDCIVRSGCCSHHGGVQGCSNGRQVCRDGTLSPTCTCYKEDIEQEV